MTKSNYFHLYQLTKILWPNIPATEMELGPMPSDCQIQQNEQLYLHVKLEECT